MQEGIDFAPFLLVLVIIGLFGCVYCAICIAYIGIGQVSKPLESEKLAYNYMLEQYTKAGNRRMVNKLKKYPITELDSVPNSYRPLRDETMHDLGIGTTHNMKSVVSGIFIPSWKIPEYTITG